MSTKPRSGRDEEEDEITGEIIEAAIDVHRERRSGLPQLACEQRLCYELSRRRLGFHDAQLLTYLKLYRRPLELLINFHVPVLKNGIKRLVNNYIPSSAPRPLGG